MDILDTIEARWFLDDAGGAAATAARACFAKVAVEGPREDRYLLTGRDDIGLKARVALGKPATVEAKYLLGSLGPTRLHARITGVIERWRKLSLELADPALQKDGAWIRVVKSRRLRKLGYEEGVLKEIALEARASAGCGVELTELEYDDGVGRGHSLTVALEAFGPEALLLDVLLGACREVFDSASALELEAGASKGYPRWLATISDGSGRPASATPAPTDRSSWSHTSK